MIDPKAYADGCKKRLYGIGVNSHDRVYALLKCMEDAPGPEHMWRVFNLGWGTCDAVHPETVAELLALLRPNRPFGTAYLERDDLEFFDSLPEVVTIFRGSSPSRKRGMAWTTNEQVAEGFAHGHRGMRVPNGTIFTAKVGKADILSVATDREEFEVLVDPASLARVHTFRKL